MLYLFQLIYSIFIIAIALWLFVVLLIAVYGEYKLWKAERASTKRELKKIKVVDSDDNRMATSGGLVSYTVVGTSTHEDSCTCYDNSSGRMLDIQEEK